MTSSILAVNCADDIIMELGADGTRDVVDAGHLLENRRYTVIGVDCGDMPVRDLLNFFSVCDRAAPDAVKVLFFSSLNPIELCQLTKATTFFRIIESPSRKEVADAFQGAVERAHLVQQQDDLLRLVNEQNRQLVTIKTALEERVEKRSRSLVRSRDRLLKTNQTIEWLQASLMAIYRARSITEIENYLRGALQDYIPLESVRIFYFHQSNIRETATDENPPYRLLIPLLMGSRHLGEAVFLKSKVGAFSEAEAEFLAQVCESVAMAIDRLNKIDQSEILKAQWQATFDSIVEPICLTDSEFNILRTNRAFAESTRKAFKELIGKDCFVAFFGKPHKPHQEISHITRDTGGKVMTFEVKRQALNFKWQDSEVNLVLFRDVSQQLLLERQLLESSKMAELGLIGSSIAHELNNPLGGMLSFLQLIEMDASGKESWFEDIKEMQNAVYRSRDIVQDLLGFARRGDSSERVPVSVSEVVEQALRLTELRTRSQGIAIEWSRPEEELQVRGQANQLTQAIGNLLQNSTEAILDKRKSDSRFNGRIRLVLRREGQNAYLTITDDGPGIPAAIQQKIFNPLFTTKSARPNSGLGLTIAYKIISEHGGTLEIHSQPGVETRAGISLPLLDLSLESQGFDGKI